MTSPERFAFPALALGAAASAWAAPEAPPLPATAPAVATATAPGEPAEPAVPGAEIEAWVGREMARLGVPGWALAVSTRNGVRHVAAGGRADGSGRPVTTRTPFVIASLSKSFIALALVQLADDGRLSLDDPVAKHLPGLALAGPEGARITVRHLLNQTSGIPRRAGLEGMYSGRPMEWHLARLADVHLDRPVGARFVYSNTNYLVAEALLARVAGVSAADQLAARVFGPLGMRDTFVGEAAAAAAAAAGTAEPPTRGHRFWFGTPRMEDLPIEFGSILLTSAGDFARALVPHLAGGTAGDHRLLSAAGLATLHTPPAGSRYAMGWEENEVLGLRTLRHSGASATHRADMAIVPERGVGLAILANASHHLAHADFRRIADGATAMLLRGPAPVHEGETFADRTRLAAILLALFGAVPLISLVLLPRWRRRLPRKAATPARFALRVALPATLQIAAPFIAWLAVPAFADTPFEVLWLFLPDLGLLLLAITAAFALLGALRLSIGLRAAPWRPATESGVPPADRAR